MTAKHPAIYVGHEALAELVKFCAAQGLHSFTLIADDNTYAALGKAAETALRQQGWNVLTIILKGDDIGADARYILTTLLELDRVERTFVAAGSGTITDIARFVSHRSRAEFISLPTAPSVDGYTSVGAPLAVEGAKLTIDCHGPIAVFADIPTLCAAPRRLLGAGMGDMLAKLTSVADWELGGLVWDEVTDPVIGARARAAAWLCADQADSVAAGGEAGVRALMEGLIESGLCMLDFGATTLASGLEHHFSHFLEMKLLREGRHSILHGAKVGLGVLISAGLYEQVRALSRSEAEARLSRFALPDRDAEIAAIKAAYPNIYDMVIQAHQPITDMTGEQLAALKQRILDNWDAIQQVAATVPPAADFRRWIAQAGGPVTPAEVGLSDEEAALAAQAGPYFRNRFTIAKLARMLGLV